MRETPKEVYIIIGPDSGAVYRVTGEQDNMYYLEDGECTISIEKWKCIPVGHHLAMEALFNDTDCKGVF
jgi:hypothetical protein